MNKRHKLLSAAAAATLGLAGLIGAAAPAQAAQVGQLVISGGGAACSTFSVSGSGATAQGSNWNFAGDATDTVRVLTSDVGCTFYIDRGGVVSGPFTTASAPQDVTLSGGGDFCITTTNGGACVGNVLFYLIPSSSPTPEPSGDSTGSQGPAPVIQQFGMPATGTCDEAQPEGLNLAGVPSGGWGISWAQWMNGGTGGAVCTRTLNYSSAQSKWVVN